MSRSLFFRLALVFFAACTASAHAEKKTVCSITVNSADEKDTFRDRLPKGDYEFVELVEKGRPDWLRSSCQRNVQCDVLVVSGHFNAGDTFYSDRLEKSEYLAIDELERASCSGSCPGVFARLKEVYLFGCESLNPDASKYGSSFGESGRERMRRIFNNVPVIYGFSSAAPVGPTAAMLLNRYFDGAGGGEIGSGRGSSRLLQMFTRNSMVRVSGAGESEERRQICRFFDERKSAGQKLGFIHGLLRGEGRDAQGYFARIEKLFASLTEAERQSSAFTQALAEISADDAARSRYLTTLRSERQPPLRARMIALASTLGWFSDDQQRAETVAMIGDVLAAREVGFAEVELVCSLNADGHLNGALSRLSPATASASRAGAQAIMACMGNDMARGQMLKVLASANEKDVQVAQAYLRHRPLAHAEELRSLAKDVARRPDPGPAQVRALDALARMHIADREILEDLSRAFAETKSLHVQRAIAEVFIRSDPKAMPKHGLAMLFQQHRIRPPGGGHDLIDALIARLQASS